MLHALHSTRCTACTAQHPFCTSSADKGPAAPAGAPGAAVPTRYFVWRAAGAPGAAVPKHYLSGVPQAHEWRLAARLAEDQQLRPVSQALYQVLARHAMWGRLQQQRLHDGAAQPPPPPPPSLSGTLSQKQQQGQRQGQQQRHGQEQGLPVVKQEAQAPRLSTMAGSSASQQDRQQEQGQEQEQQQGAGLLQNEEQARKEHQQLWQLQQVCCEACIVGACPH